MFTFFKKKPKVTTQYVYVVQVWDYSEPSENPFFSILGAFYDKKNAEEAIRNDSRDNVIFRMARVQLN